MSTAYNGFSSHFFTHSVSTIFRQKRLGQPAYSFISNGLHLSRTFRVTCTTGVVIPTQFVHDGI